MVRIINRETGEVKFVSPITASNTYIMQSLGFEVEAMPEYKPDPEKPVNPDAKPKRPYKRNTTK